MDTNKKASTAIEAHQTDDLQKQPNQPNQYSAEVCVITSQQPKMLTKSYLLGADGTLTKSTVANMSLGSAQVIKLNDLSDFAQVLSSLTHNQAMCYGRPLADEIGIISKNKFEEAGKPKEYVTRTKDHFQWPAVGGVMMLDYDPSKKGNDGALTKEQLFEVIEQATPSLLDKGKIWWGSSSSHICNSETGEELTGLKGQRVYYLAKDASDIQRAGKVLVERLWLNGGGYYEVSRSGALLERCAVDSSVWQPNRLDFAAGAKCTSPIEQKRGDPEIYGGGVVDTRSAFPNLSDKEKAQLETIKKKLRDDMAQESENARQVYIEELKAEILLDGCGDQRAEHINDIVTRAVNKKVLTGEFPITMDDGENTTIAEILDDVGKYHGRQTLDPLEPEYENKKVVGKLYLIGSRPNLHSFAHGGNNYRLLRQPSRIEVVEGDTHSAVNETLMLIRQLDELYDFGGTLATVYNGKINPVDADYLAHWLGGVIQYWKWGVSGGVAVERNIDPPTKLVKAIMALRDKRDLKKLDAVITAQIMTPSGHIIKKLGYDAKSRLILDTTDFLPSVPDEPTEQQVDDAIKTLMHPFESFPFCSKLDRSVLLAALLTAALRPVLPTAPAFAFDAAIQGSGKTLLAKCVSAVATGREPEIIPHLGSKNDDEIRKRLFAALLGGSSAIIWDNVLGIFDSAALAGFLTASLFSDRILGKSQMPSVPNRAVFLMTGNNLMLAGDMPRRVLKCRIDPLTERPFARNFDIDPEQYCLDNRQTMITAALTIVRGWFNSADYMAGKTATGRMASFEIWDDMVRQPLAWIARDYYPEQFADVMKAIDEAQQNDPEKEALYDFLCEVQEVLGEQSFTSKNLYDKFTFNQSLQESADGLFVQKVSSVVQLGRQLGFRKDRIVNGLCLRCKTINKTNHFRVVEHKSDNLG